jgi:hypothetical protein
MALRMPMQSRDVHNGDPRSALPRESGDPGFFGYWGLLAPVIFSIKVMPSDKRVLIAFATAPLATALVMSVVAATSETGGLLAAIVVFQLAVLFAVFTQIIVATPLFFLARRFNLIKWWSCTIVGGAVGMTVALITHTFTLLLLFATCGAASGLTFWAVYAFGSTGLSKESAG